MRFNAISKLDKPIQNQVGKIYQYYDCGLRIYRSTAIYCINKGASHIYV